MAHSAVIIGGSAGSFQVVVQILSSLRKDFPLPIFLCLHRLKHVRSGFTEALSLKSTLPVTEPDDKESIKSGVIYLSPANYHMYIELGSRISLSTEEQENHSRPSIDLSFFTAAYNYKEKVVGIILSGANKDGSQGLKRVKESGGTTIIQSPQESQVATMPNACLQVMQPDHIFSTTQIIQFLNKIQ